MEVIDGGLSRNRRGADDWDFQDDAEPLYDEVGSTFGTRSEDPDLRVDLDQVHSSEPESEKEDLYGTYGNLFGGFTTGGKAADKSASVQAAKARSTGPMTASDISTALDDDPVSDSYQERSQSAYTPTHSAAHSSSHSTDHVAAHTAAAQFKSSSELDAMERRWAWAEIDTEAIRHNIGEVKKRLSPGTAIMAVVKADAYGHGAVQVAKVALNCGASRLGVSSVDEAIELRDAGITAPIQLLAQPPISSIPAVLDYDIIPAVYTMDFALELGEAADAQGTTALFHLAVNTGMNRIGLRPEEVVEFCQALSFHRGLVMEGIFTHFAMADTVDTWALKQQLTHFEQVLEALRYAGINPGIAHAAASAAAIRFKQTHFDMIRLGIAMYGLHPSDVTKGTIDLRPAMSVHARVTQVNEVPVGGGVSYGFTYRSPGSVIIATLPLGYADGMPRVLSNHMHVSLKGDAWPQVGNICMDQMMFEVDLRRASRLDGPAVKIGDEVTIIGDDRGILLTLDDMARALGTINYELACRFGMRLPRVYR